MATVLALLVIMGVFLLISLLGEVKYIGEGDYGMMQAIYFLLLRMPSEIYRFSPMLILLGSILGVGVLSSHRELVVMQAAGLSQKRIMTAILCGAFIMVLGMILVGEWIGPELNYKAEISKENARNKGQAVVTGSGVWFHVSHNFIHVDHVVGRQHFNGITRYEFNENHELKTAYFAKSLSLKNKKWMMKDVVKTTFFQNRTHSVVIAKMPWNLKFNFNLLNVGLIEPEEMSLSKLIKFSHYLKQNGLRATEYQFEFWQRLYQPLASLIMVLLALPFALSAASLGWRMILGLMTGIAFFMLNAFLGQISIVYQVPAALGALIPLIFLSMTGAFLSKSMIRR